jgi:hypothetical protein
LRRIQAWAIPKDSDDHQRSDIFAVLLGAGSLMGRPPKLVIHRVSHFSDWEA